MGFSVFICRMGRLAVPTLPSVYSSASVLTHAVISQNLHFLFPSTNRRGPSSAPGEGILVSPSYYHYHYYSYYSAFNFGKVWPVGSLHPLSGLLLTWKGRDYLHFTDHRTSEQPEGPSRLMQTFHFPPRILGPGWASALHTAMQGNSAQLAAQWESSVLKGTCTQLCSSPSFSEPNLHPWVWLSDDHLLCYQWAKRTRMAREHEVFTGEGRL